MATPEQSKKLLRRRTSSKKGAEKNPYSDRGVDKFSELLAEIEEKKRMIYSQFSPEEVSAIRFVPAGSNKLKPLVVRAASSNKLGLHSTQVTQPSKTKIQDEIDDVMEEDQLKPEMIELVGTDVKKGEEEESLWLVEVMTKLEGFTNYNYKGIGGLILVLLLALVFWRYFLLNLLQATVCPRIQTI